MPGITFFALNEPKRKKCDLCERTILLTRRMLITRDGTLVGDLELCDACAEILAEILNNPSEEIIEERWLFNTEEDPPDTQK